MRGLDKRSGQSGTTTVEFAVVATLLMTILFSVIEFGRALFVVNTLTEATRRGARLAAVCPLGDPKPVSAALFAPGGGDSPVIPGLTRGNVVIEYLDGSGAVIANPAANFNSIQYVRARITGFHLPLLIPLLMPTLTLDGFAATLPRESLGVPRTGPINSC